MYLFVFVTLGFFNDILSYLIIMRGHSNHFNSNIYVLMAFLLLLAQFYMWNKVSRRKYILLAIAGCWLWISDHLILNDIKSNNSIFRFAVSFIFLYLCIEQINKLIIYENKALLKNPIFLTCTGLVIHFSFKAFIETFNFYEWAFETRLAIRLNIVMATINIISYVLTSIAFLCIRARPTYFYPY